MNTGSYETIIMVSQRLMSIKVMVIFKSKVKIVILTLGVDIMFYK